MRSAFVAAAFAAGAIAVPYQHHHLHKRDVVTTIDYEIVYVTNIVTVTANGPPPQQTPNNKLHYHHQPDHNQGSNPPAHNPPPANQPNANPAPSPGQTDLGSSPTPQPNPNQGGDNSGNGNSNGNGNGNSGGGNSGSGGLSGSAGSSYQDITLFHHNLHRRNHSASEIQWDNDLAKSAADIAATCIYEHNVVMDGGGYGQNIAAGVAPDNISAIITDLFYNGEVNYYQGLYGESNPSMSNFESWGHFSQIVWKATTHVACATQDCSAKGLANVGGDVRPYFTVCNYRSPGNVGGAYGDNVGEPLGEPTAQWNTGL